MKEKIIQNGNLLKVWFSALLCGVGSKWALAFSRIVSCGVHNLESCQIKNHKSEVSVGSGKII